MKNALLTLLSVICFLPLNAAAQDAVAPAAANPAPVPQISSGLPVPRFVSLRSEKVFVRTGPALRYPIKWVYSRPDLPVEVVQEFDTWRKIRDIDGDEGWVHQSLLSAKRAALVKAEGEVNLNKGPDMATPVLARLEPKVVAHVAACVPGWCEVEAGGYKGWAERKYLWGVYEAEQFN